MNDIEEIKMIIEDIFKLKKMKKEMMITSGMVLGAKNIFAKDTDIFNNIKYKEHNSDLNAYENIGVFKEVNECYFWDRPEPTPRKKWYH